MSDISEALGMCRDDDLHNDEAIGIAPSASVERRSKIEAAKSKINAILREDDLCMEDVQEKGSVVNSQENGDNSWLAIGLWTWLVLGLSCMGLGAAIMSGEGKGFALLGKVVLSEKGLSTMLWTRAVFEIIWISVFFGMGCAAISKNGLRGFKRLFWGAVIGGVMAGMIWSVGSAIYDSAKQEQARNRCQGARCDSSAVRSCRACGKRLCESCLEYGHIVSRCPNSTSPFGNHSK